MADYSVHILSSAFGLVVLLGGLLIRFLGQKLEKLNKIKVSKQLFDAEIKNMKDRLDGIEKALLKVHAENREDHKELFKRMDECFKLKTSKD